MHKQASDLFPLFSSAPPGHRNSPLSKVTLTLITISTCVLAMVYAAQDPCPLTVKVTLHVPEHFVADGESIAVIQSARKHVARHSDGLANV